DSRHDVHMRGDTLYPMLLPNLPAYVRGLLKLLLVASPSVPFKDHLIDVRYEIVIEIDGLPQPLPDSEVELRRHKEVLLRCISFIILNLLKYFRYNRMCC